MHQRLSNVLFGRQPIVNRLGLPVAYELLFRDSANYASARVEDDALATAKVVQAAFGKLGIRTVVGDRRAFINLDAEWLHAPAVFRLPRESTVLEILETVEINAKMVERCRMLKAMGYTLALDDVASLDAGHEALLDIVDIVKIDVLQVHGSVLEDLVKRLRIKPTRLLAEKVDSVDCARRCIALGFDYLQGFAFGRARLIVA